MVCISSINKIMLPSDSSTSLRTAFNLSSNSPRNFAPAIKAPISNAKSLLLCKLSGTSLLIMRIAKPSTMAVLPTPGSPIKTGLFLVRRDNTCIVLLISCSRPITGSNLPSLALAVISMAYFFKALKLSSALSLSATLPFLISLIA